MEESTSAGGALPDRLEADGAARQPLSGRRIILGVTGSIAAYKAAELVRQLGQAGAEVQVLMTEDACRFIAPLTLGTLSKRDVLIEIFPENEDGSWTKHVQLGIWADLFIVAPATATTIARLATGVCDSMLTATALSRRCPMLVCPAMDHDMFGHPATRRNLDTLREDGVDILPPDFGELASGLVGDGRLPEPEVIVRAAVERLGASDGPLRGSKVVVTAGPTREPIDPVRFLTNGSTGTMGFALAEAASRRGAEVVLVAGPTPLPTPPRVHRIDVATADEMYEAVMQHAGADVLIGAAAVADYAPARPSHQKIKKREGEMSLEMRRTPDIIAAVGAQKRIGQIVVGFALETENGPENARAKLESKNLDLVVLNIAGEPGSGFGADTNRVTLIAAEGEPVELPRLTKREVAERILDRVSEMARVADTT